MNVLEFGGEKKPLNFQALRKAPLKKFLYIFS